MPDTTSATVPTLPEATTLPRSRELPGRVIARILPTVSFTFVCYLTIGIPLAILPMHVHLRLGYGTVLAGFVISTQYVATVVSRPRVGRMVDVLGPKRIAVLGLFACAVSGALTFAAAFLNAYPPLCLAVLLSGRLLLGIGESMVGTGAIMWGIGRAGAEHIAKVISWSGVATFSALAVGAPLGVLLQQHWGFASAGVAVFALSLAAVALAFRLPRIPVSPSRHLPFAQIFWRVAPFGGVLALGGIGFGVLATFISLYFAQVHWSGAALTLTIYGACFVVTRLLFVGLITRVGGFPVAIVSLFIEIFGLLLLGFARVPFAAFVAAALIGVGFSLVFPSLAVEAVRHIPVENRGTALGAYNAFIDLSLFLTGPIAGVIISHSGYNAVFLTCAAGVFLAFCLTIALASRHHTPVTT